jgi:SNF2 family DNA or RNA helicase
MEKILVTTRNGSISINAPFRYKDVCKGLPGARWNPATKAWTVPTSPISAQAITQAFAGIKLETDEGFDRLALIDMEKAQANKEATNLWAIPCTKTEPWLHQLRGYHFIKDLPAAGLFYEMGAGKSKPVVDLIVNQDLQRVLVICPKSVNDVWPMEFDKHAGKPVEVVALRDGSVAKRLSRAQLFMALNKVTSKPTAFIINYESAWREPFAKWALAQEWDLVVLDEGHRVKAPGGVASQFCTKLGKHAKRRLVLTGTPLPHSPLDAYSIYRFLDPAIFGTSFVKFRSHYARMGGYGNHQVMAFQNLEEMNQKMYSIAYRVEKGDVLDLPEALHIERYCQMGAEASRMYQELTDQYLTQIEQGELTVSNALTKLLRLQQLTSGYAKLDDGQEVKVDTAKEDLLADVIEDLPLSEPLVIFARFHHDLDAIAQVLQKAGRTVGELSGRVNQLKDWQEGKFNSLVVQIQSGGVGIDLTRARYCIYYSIGFNLGDYLQSLARVHRPGQTRETFYIHLLAQGTVDTDIEVALEKRQDLIRYVLDRLGKEGEM